jgi:hypothetical protein
VARPCLGLWVKLGVARVADDEILEGTGLVPESMFFIFGRRHSRHTFIFLPLGFLISPNVFPCHSHRFWPIV